MVVQSTIDLWNGLPTSHDSAESCRCINDVAMMLTFNMLA